MISRMADNKLVAHIAYDGDALKDGSMDIRELAPALLALGDLLQGANRVLNGNRATLAVKVQADFKTGSFDVGLALAQDLTSTVMSLIGSDGIKSAKEIAEFVGLVTGVNLSVFGVLKWLKGRKVESASKRKDGKVEIKVKVEGDNNTVEIRVVEAGVYEVTSDAGCRKAVEGVVRPLKAEGIDRFETRKGKTVVERIEKKDLPSLEMPTPPATDLDAVAPVTQVVEVVKPSFDEDLTWTLSDGSGGRFDVVMKDQAFIDRVKAGEDFRIGDLLKVRIETKQSIGISGLRTRREVTQVIEEIKAPRQSHLLPTPRFKQPSLLDGSNTVAARKGRGRKGKGRRK